MIGLLRWHDAIEIIFFVFLCYQFTNWLKQDTQKNLLGYFWGYCALLSSAHFFQFQTIFSFLSLYTPVFIMLFILVHEQTIQRNLITAQNSTLKKGDSNVWLEIIISYALQQLHTNKKTVYLIEHRDQIQPYLLTPFFISAPIQKELLMSFIHNPEHENKMIWITSQGTLHSPAASWREIPSIRQCDTFFDYALFFTSQTDALIIIADPINDLFSIIAQGKHTANISVDHAVTIVKKHLHHHINSSNKKGVLREEKIYHYQQHKEFTP